MTKTMKAALAAAFMFLTSGTPMQAQEANWVQPCDVADAFVAAGRAGSDAAQVYEKMCDLVGNAPVADACLQLRAIEAGVRPKPGERELSALGETCDAAIIAGPPASMADTAAVPSGPTLGGMSATPAAPATATAPAEDPAVEMAFWESVKDSDDPAMFTAYLRQYPQGAFASIAEARIQALVSGEGDENDVVVVPSPAPAPSTNTVVIEKVVPGPAIRGNATARNVQRQLKRVGCYYGAVDGIWGSGSRQAIRRFNRQTGRKLNASRPAPRQVTVIKSYRYRVCR